MTPKHSCTQVEEIIENTKDIKVLYSYREEDMKVIKDLSTDVKDIKKFIFEGWMDAKYIRKDVFVVGSAVLSFIALCLWIYSYFN